MWETVFAAVIAFCAYTVKGNAGFGNSLIFNPTVSQLYPAQTVASTDVMLSLPINSYLTYRYRRHFDKKIVLPVAAMLVIGSIPGMLFLKYGGDEIVKILLGAVVILIAADMFYRNQFPQKAGKKIGKGAMLALGLVAGVLSGMFGMAMLIVAYIGRSVENSEAFKTNTCAVLLIDGVFRTIFYTAGGLISKDALFLTAVLMPAAVLGMAFGIKLNLKIPEKVSNTIISIIIASSGIFLIVRNIIAVV